jgi:hypothetical protein
MHCEFGTWNFSYRCSVGPNTEMHEPRQSWLDSNGRKTDGTKASNFDLTDAFRASVMKRCAERLR